VPVSIKLHYNRDAEVGIIGACLDGGIETSVIAVESIPSRCFYHDDTRFLFEAIGSMVSNGTAPDTFALVTAWKAAQPALAFPADIYSAQDHHNKWSLPQRREVVLECYKRRHTTIAAHALMTDAQDEAKPIADSLAAFEAAVTQNHTQAPAILGPKDLDIQLTADLDRLHQLQGRLSGYATGFDDLDEKTNGIQLGEFWIIGARPNVGKTALALNLTESVAFNQNTPVLFVSLEMTAQALMRRLLSMNAWMDASAIKRGNFTQDHIEKKVPLFRKRLLGAPLHILDAPGGIKATQLCHSIRAAIRQWGIKVVILDYLQKIKPDTKGEKRTYEIGDTSSQLVDLIKRERINMIALAQLNRESEKEKGRTPRLSDLADSKSIEADADFVGLLNRPINNDEKKAQLIVAKQRDGERGIINLNFNGAFCRFSGYTNHEPDNTNDD
jgi:replicative DNA helicase